MADNIKDPKLLGGFRTPAEMESIGKGFIDLSSDPRLAPDIEILRDPEADPQAQLEAYNRMEAFANRVFIDADTLRGSEFGLSRNIRMSGYDALEDPLKNMPAAQAAKAKAAEKLGRKATNAAVQSFIGGLVSGEKAGIYLEGKVDRPDLRTARELGEFITIDGQNNAIAPLARDLLDTGNATLYNDGTDDYETYRKKQEFTAYQLAKAYREYQDSGTPEARARYEKLREKQKFLLDSEVDRIFETKFDPTNFESWADAAAQGVDSVGAMLFEVVANTTDAVFGEGKGAISRKNAEYLRERAKMFAERTGNPYGIQIGRAAVEGDAEVYEAVKEGVKGLANGLAEIGMTAANAPAFALFVFGKATEMAKEKRGDGYNYADVISQLPFALVYAGLNKAEAGVLTGAVSKEAMKRIPGLAKAAGGLGAAMAVEGAAEAVQTYTERADWDKLGIDRKLGNEMIESGILGALGGGVPGAVQSGVTAAGQATGLVADIGKKGIQAGAEKIRDITEQNQQKAAISKAEERVEAELTTAMKEYADVIEIDTGRDDVGYSDFLSKEGRDSLIQALEDKLEAKKQRLRNPVRKDGGRYTDETIEKMKAEVADLEAKLAEAKKDPAGFVHKDYIEKFSKRARNISDKSLADQKARKLNLIKDLETIEKAGRKLTEKQKRFKSLLLDEIGVIEAEERRRGIGATRGSEVEESPEAEPFEVPEIVEPSVAAEPRTTPAEEESMFVSSDEVVEESPEVVEKEPPTTKPAREAQPATAKKKPRRISRATDVSKVDTVIAIEGFDAFGNRTGDNEAIVDAAVNQGKTLYIYDPKSDKLRIFDNESQELKEADSIEVKGEYGIFMPKGSTKEDVKRLFAKGRKPESRAVKKPEPAKAKEEDVSMFVSSDTVVEESPEIVEEKAEEKPSVKQKPESAKAEKKPAPKKAGPEQAIEDIIRTISLAKPKDNPFDAIKASIDPEAKDDYKKLLAEDIRTETKELYARMLDTFTKVSAAAIPQNPEELVRKKPMAMISGGITENRKLWLHPSFAAHATAAFSQQIISMRNMMATMDADKLSDLIGVEESEIDAIQQRGGSIGIPTSVFARAVGNSVLRGMGVKMNKKVQGLEIAARDQLAAEIGAYVVLGMEANGIIERKEMTMRRGRKRSFFTLTDKYREAIDDIEKDTRVVSRESLREPQVGVPHKPKQTYAMKGRDQYHSSETQTKAANIRSQNPNHVDWEFHAFFNGMPEDLQYKVLGIKPDTEVHPSVLENNKERTKSILSIKGRADDFFQQAGKKPFYYSEFMGSNGRFFLNEVAANPQTDKAYTRYMILMNPPTKLTDRGSANFKSAFLLAIGEKPEHHKSDLDTYFAQKASEIGVDFLRELGSKNPGRKALAKAAELAGDEEGMYTLKMLREMGRAVNELGIKSFDESTSFRGFRTTAVMEIDGITNGLAFLAFQAGDERWEVLNKIGVFKSPEEAIDKWRANGGRDAYEHLLHFAEQSIGAMPNTKLKQLFIELELLSRNTAKKPLMVFLYGMGLDAIKEIEVKRGLFSDILSATMNPKKREAANEFLSLATGKKLDWSKVSEISESDRQKINDALEPFSAAFTDSLVAGFPQIHNYRMLMSQSADFLHQYTRKKPGIDELLYQAIYGNEKESNLAKTRLQLRVPFIQPYGTSNIKESQPVIKFEKKAIDTSAKTDPDKLIRQRYSFKRTFDGAKPFTYIPQKLDLESGKSMAPVTTIHRNDSEAAAYMHVKTHESTGKAGLNVHDAYIGDLNAMQDAAQAYNDIFYRIGTEYSIADQMIEQVDRALKDGFKYDPQKLDDLMGVISEYRNYREKAKETYAGIASVGQMNGVVDAEYFPDSEDVLAYGARKSTANAKKPQLIEDIDAVYDRLDDGTPHSAYLRGLYLRARGVLFDGVRASFTRKRGSASQGIYDRKNETIYVWEGTNILDRNIAFTHELIHHVTAAAIDTNYSIKREIRSLADKMIQAIIRDKHISRKDKKFYIESISVAPEHELLAWFLTDPKLMALAERTPYARKKPSNLFEWAIEIWNRVLDFVNRVVFNKKATETELDHMTNLYVKLIREAKAAKRGPGSAGIVDKVTKAFDPVAAELIEKTVTFGQGYEKIGKAVSNAVITVNDFSKAVAKMDITNNETIMAIKQGIIGTKGAVANKLNDIARIYTNRIQAQTMQLQESIDRTLRKKLADYTDDELVSLQRGIIYTDIQQMVRDGWTVGQIREALQNPGRAIAKIDRELGKYFSPERLRVLQYHSDALAYFMITGENHSPIGFTNVTAFLKQNMNWASPDFDRVRALLDARTSIRSFEHVDKDGRKQAFRLLSEPQGEEVIGILNQIAQTMDDHLFNEKEKDLKIKGYFRSSYDNNNEVRIVPKDSEDYEAIIHDLELSGFRIVPEGSNKHFTMLMSPTPEPQYVQGFVSIAGSRSRGFREEADVAAYGKAVREVNRLARRGFKPTGEPLPLLEWHNGTVTRRYVMSRKRQRNLLQLNENFILTTARTAGHIVRKYKSLDLNQHLVDLIDDDWQQATPIERKRFFDTIVLPPIWTGDYTAYTMQKAAFEAQPEKMKRYAQMLPSKTVLHAYRIGMSELHIRKEMRPVLMGFREMVLAVPKEITLLGKPIKMPPAIYNPRVNYVLRIVDIYMKDIVRFLKGRIVLFNPAIHVGNMVSNIFILYMNGLNPKEIYQYLKEGAEGLTDYREHIRELTDLRLLGKGDTPRARRLERLIRENPVRDSIDAGLFSFIVEDVTNEAIQRHNVFEERAKAVVKGAIGKGVEMTGLDQKWTDKTMKALERVYVTENTPEGKAMVLAMQYSDFMAKHAIMRKYGKKLGRDGASQLSNDLFIDYRYNDSQFLDYLNKIGVFPFSKFAIRIQRAAWRTVEKSPARVLFSVVAADIASEGVLASIEKQNIFIHNVGTGMFNTLGTGIDPFDVFETPWQLAFK